MFGRPVEITKGPSSNRRTIYGFIDRQNLPGLFRTFDLASPDTTNPQRYLTTVPQQALFLLNSPFAQEQAKAMVQRREIAEEKDSAARVQALYRVAYARSADADEVRLGEQFLASAQAAAEGEMNPLERYAQVLLLANEFMFVD